MSGLMRHKRTRQLAIWIGAAVAAVLVIAAFALVWRATAPGRVGAPPPPAIEEAEPTTESVSPTDSAIAALPDTSTAEATSSTNPTSVPAPVVPGGGGALIAYRLGPNLYVADEQGRNANAVALAPSGDFTLSPDSRTIAVVDGDTRQLVFIDIASRTVVEAGTVAGGRPVWMPDSSGVLLPVIADATTGATRIDRFGRDGGSALTIGAGGMAAVSPDAGTIVLGPGAGATAAEGSRVTIVRNGRPTSVKLPGLVTAVAAANDQVFVGAMGEQGPGLWTIPQAGGAPRAMIPVGEGSPYTTLSLSPDASSLAFAVGGDDGYSRVSVIPARGGSAVRLWVRRDDYVLQWSRDSMWVYLIEGNAIQGESTSLYRVGRAGNARRLLVQGASL